MIAVKKIFGLRKAATHRSGGTFGRFTRRAKRVLQLAQEEARSLHHDYLGSEHILLGLIAEREGIAACVLAELGVELDLARTAVVHIVGRGEHAAREGEIRLTPRAKQAIELALKEAHRLGHDYIGTEHILLGLIREGRGVAMDALERLGLEKGKVRSSIEDVLRKL